jgi:putative flippase GtrA
LVETPAPSGARRRTLFQWLRHHTTSVLSTVVDYGVMVAAVELGHLRPVLATVIGAFCGALTNFFVNRTFTYHAQAVRVRGQAWRFALVSGTSLALNAGGEYLFHNVLGIQYLIARIITSVIVSNAWNYPMLRFFVFSTRPRKHA